MLVDSRHGKHLESIDPEVKRSKVKVTWLSVLLPLWVCKSIRLLKFLANSYYLHQWHLCGSSDWPHPSFCLSSGYRVWLFVDTIHICDDRRQSTKAVSVCLHSKRKTALAFDTKVGRYAAHGRQGSAYNDPDY